MKTTDEILDKAMVWISAEDKRYVLMCECIIDQYLFPMIPREKDLITFGQNIEGKDDERVICKYCNKKLSIRKYSSSSFRVYEGKKKCRTKRKRGK